MGLGLLPAVVGFVGHHCGCWKWRGCCLVRGKHQDRLARLESRLGRRGGCIGLVRGRLWLLLALLLALLLVAEEEEVLVVDDAEAGC